jgi:formate/nitrite transporter FocA (FNT family)
MRSGWGVLFLKAIPANAMVCMAVMLGFASRDSAGKIMALWFPVVMFVLCGYEHCVANSTHRTSCSKGFS